MTNLFVTPASIKKSIFAPVIWDFVIWDSCVQSIHCSWLPHRFLPATTTKVLNSQKEGDVPHTFCCLYSLGSPAQWSSQHRKHFKARFPDASWGQPCKQARLRLRSIHFVDSFCIVVSLQCRFLTHSALTLYSLFQFEPQLHRSDWVSLHVALLLPAHLLWRNADNRQCHDPQWHGRHRKNCRQGETALWLVVNLDLAQTFLP